MSLSLPTLETGSGPFYYLGEYLRKEKKIGTPKSGKFGQHMGMSKSVIFLHLQVFDFSQDQFYVKIYASGLIKKIFLCAFHPR